MAKDTKLTFRINSEILEEFKKEAEKRGISQSDLFLEYQEIYREQQNWRNSYYRTHELAKFVTQQIQELQNYDVVAEQADDYVEDEVTENYLKFLNKLDDEIRNLPTYWEPKFKEDEYGDWIWDENRERIPDDEGNKRPW